MENEKDESFQNSKVLKTLKCILSSIDTLMILNTLNFAYIRTESGEGATYYRLIIIFILAFYFYFRLKHWKD